MATNTALAKSPQEKYKTVFGMLQRRDVVNQISLALPKHLTPERMIRVALSAIQKTPALLECDERSLIGSIIEASQLGLEPNGVLGEGYLIPRRNKKTGRKEATFMPGYRGLTKLARNSGEISLIYAEVVQAADEFLVEYGTDKKLVHKPALEKEDRGAFRGAYAVVKYKDGETDFVYLPKGEVDKIRKSSQSPDDGPWKTHYNEMAKKSAIRRLAKSMPLTSEDKRFHQAVARDEGVDLGSEGFMEIETMAEPVDPTPISDEQRSVIFKLKEDAKCPNEALEQILGRFGFDTTAQVTVGEYDDFCQAIKTWDKAEAQGTNGDDSPDSPPQASAGAAEANGGAGEAKGEQPAESAPEVKSGPVGDDLIEKQRSGLFDAFEALRDAKGTVTAKDCLEKVVRTRVPEKVKDEDLGVAIAALNARRMER